MRTIKKILPLVAICFFTTSHAQFWKKITKRAERAAEEAVERKVEEKAARETEKTFDTVFNNKGKLFKKKKASKLDSYSFTHRYVMELISENDSTEIIYYLTNDHEYMASSFKMKNAQEFFTVMDLPNTAVHTFMNLGNKKSMSSFKIDLEEVDEAEMNINEFTITTTGQTKEIIGYQCEEYQVTGPQLSGKIWVTQDAGISIQKAFSRLQSKKIKGLKGMNQSWTSMVDGLVLEMKMIDYSQRNPEPIHMICTSLEETEFNIYTADYENQF
jgi:arsenate reductase-like glutaredoxin family protein